MKSITCIAGKISSVQSKIKMIHCSNREVPLGALKISNYVPIQPSPAPKNCRKLSALRSSDEGRNSIETIAKSHFNFDHKLWWESHGDVVRHLLESDRKSSNVGIIDGHTETAISKADFEGTYASDAIYQDLFIDSPPCRKTLKLSFALMNRFWDIKITEWNPPILMSTLADCKAAFEPDNSESMGKVACLSNTFFLRVPYTANQRPRLFFLPTAFWNKFPKMKEIFLFHYEGWIDLYIQPITSSTHTSRDGSSRWKVYRHDDRVRLDPPSFFVPLFQRMNNQMRAGDPIDALSTVENIALISTVFQCFRRAHGMVVCYFAKKKILTSSQ